jgi:hypothetical protein
MTRITNPKYTVIAIPAAGQVLISATKSCKYVEIVEVPPATFNNTTVPFAPQGLLYALPDDNYVHEYGLLPAQTWTGGDNTYRGKLGFAFQGATDPAGNTIPATPYMKIASASGVATQIQLTEWS